MIYENVRPTVGNLEGIFINLVSNEVPNSCWCKVALYEVDNPSIYLTNFLTFSSFLFGSHPLHRPILFGYLAKEDGAPTLLSSISSMHGLPVPFRVLFETSHPNCTLWPHCNVVSFIYFLLIFKFITKGLLNSNLV